MRCTCLLLALFSVRSAADAGTSSSEDLSRFISSTKAELARSFFGPRVVKKDVVKVKVTEERDAEIKFAGAGHLGALFRRSKENYIVNGFKIFQLRKKHASDGDSRKYFLDSVQEFPVDEGAILFEQTEWKKIFFLAVCYRRNFCRAFMSHPTRSVTFQQKLSVQSQPSDLRFFVEDEALFLIVAGDPCKIYRWTGTYFDEYEELDTTGATAVATFRDSDSTVIIVAQNLQFKEVYSKVFLRKNRKTELIQILQTKGASDVVPYSVDSGNDTLNFIFVLSNGGESTVFWWNGREFSVWKRMQDVVGPGRIYVYSLLSNLFFFFAHQNKLRIYHPTEMAFDLIHAVNFDKNILDLDLREEVDRSPMLLLLMNSDSESVLTVSLMSFDVSYVPFAGNQIAIDPVLQCLLQLKNLLQNRDAKLNESMILSNEVAKKSKIIELKKLSIPKVELKSFTINELKVNPSGEELEATPTEIREKLEKLKEESDAVLAELKSKLKQVRYRFHGDIVVGRMKASSIHVKKFNDRAFDLNNIISVTKNQTLSGAIHLKSLYANALTLPSISGVYVKDILLRKKTLQAITGEHTVRSLKARNVVFGRLGKLNGSLFSSVRGGHDGQPREGVSQRKTFARMAAARLQVDYINNEPAEQWLSRILPTTRDFAPQEEALNFTRLQVTHLTVDNINGMEWQNYLMASERSARKGNRSTAEKLDAVHLRTKKINGIEPGFFLTKDTPQKVDSTIVLTSVTSKSVKAKIFVAGPGARSGQEFRKEEPEPSGRRTPLAVSEIIFNNAAEISGRRVNFHELNKTYWMKSWPQEIDASITFTNLVKAKNLGANTINRIPARSFVCADAASIEGPIIFEDVTVVGNVEAASHAHRNVNLKKLYNSAVKTWGENSVKGRKSFLGTVSAKHLSLDSLNGLPFGDPHSQATGIVAVQQVEIMGNVSAKDGVRLKYLNGHNFDDVMLKHVRLDERDVLQKGNYSSISAKEMKAENINGVPSASRFASRNKNGRLRMVVRGNLEVPQLELTTINNITVDGYLNKVVLRSGIESTVTGRKLFHKVVTVRGNLDGVLNGYNFMELEEIALSKSKPQNVTGSLAVDVLNVNNADCEVIDGVPSGALLFHDSSAAQAIHSDITFADFAIAGNIRSNIFMDGCDLSTMTRLKINEVRRVGKLDVMGNVTWKRDRTDDKGISYLYANAVTKHEEQIVGGSLTFRGDVTFDKLTTKNNINDVDLEFIVKDAIYGSIPIQEVSQDITFRGKMTANNVLIENNIIVDNINGVDILDLGQRLIRNSADTEIRGEKKFLYGFTTHSFTSEAVNGARTEPIIFCDGEANGITMFTATTFRSVKTLKDLDVLRVNDVNLSNLLEGRLSKKLRGEVGASLRIKGPVSIKGDAGISRINDLNVEDTVSTSGEVNPRSINGKLEFNGSLSATEKLQVEKLNSRNMMEIKERLLLNGTDSVINGNVIFKGNVEIGGNVDAAQGVNGCEIKNITLMELPKNMGYPERVYAAKIETEIDKITKSSNFLEKPIIFVDLYARASINLPISKVESIKCRYAADRVEVDVYGLDGDEQRCRSHSDCNCTIQKNVVISSPIADVSTSENVFPASYKYLDEYLNVEIIVTASESSHESRCDPAVDKASEYGTLHWRKGRRRESREREMEKEEDAKGNSTKISGLLRDVKFFKIADSIFVVLAFNVASVESKARELNMVIYEFDGRMETMKKVQEMGMRGVEALELFWTPKGAVLVAGNDYDSDTSADSVDSAIYRFNDSDNQFRLLRTVKTHGILHISSITQHKDSFIFLVQKQSWPFLILKYNQEYDNYYFSQKLDSDRSKVKSNFLSSAGFTTSRPGYAGDTFVGIVQHDGGFRLFRYKHIEGFVEEMRQEQRNVEMLMPFRMDSRQYLLAASSGNHSVIYEVAQHGSSR